jgi:protein-S-isoprenylcysteine O-methyltransferase Ste14
MYHSIKIHIGLQQMIEEKHFLDSPHVAVPPPIIFATGFTAAFIIERLLPLRLFTAYPFKLASWFFAFASMLIAISAVAMMLREHTNIHPHRAADHLVSGGPFRFSRNPLYLAQVLLTIGAALYLDIGWAILALVPVVIIIQSYVIRREERHLEAKFGEAYLKYKKGTRRWI